jgi:hypothetical protein
VQNAVGGLKDAMRGKITPSRVHGEAAMELLLIIVVVVLLFGGGGYWGRRQGHW